MGPQHVGMFVVTGSSSVSFKSMAVKSNERALSKTQSACMRLSVTMFDLSILLPLEPPIGA